MGYWRLLDCIMAKTPPACSRVTATSSTVGISLTIWREKARGVANGGRGDTAGNLGSSVKHGGETVRLAIVVPHGSLTHLDRME